MLNITAPLNRVPLRPITSPIRPAASEVTATGQNPSGRIRETWKLTKSPNLQHCDHGPNFYCIRSPEEPDEMRPRDDARHDTIQDERKRESKP